MGAFYEKEKKTRLYARNLNGPMDYLSCSLALIKEKKEYFAHRAKSEILGASKRNIMGGPLKGGTLHPPTANSRTIRRDSSYIPRDGDNRRQFAGKPSGVPQRLIRRASTTAPGGVVLLKGSNRGDKNFVDWFAGVLDGDGNFDQRQIRLKMHRDDINILTRIQNRLHVGKIKTNFKGPYAMWVVTGKENLQFVVNLVNGSIRLKVIGFKAMCNYLNIDFLQANYRIPEESSYLAGLIATDGSVVFNYNRNVIECNIEVKANPYSEQLDLSRVIVDYEPYILRRLKTSSPNSKKFKSIAFKYQTSRGMASLYQYAKKNPCFCHKKQFRLMQIKSFMGIRHLRKHPRGSSEFKLYSIWAKRFISHRNPSWPNVPFLKKLD